MTINCHYYQKWVVAVAGGCPEGDGCGGPAGSWIGDGGPIGSPIGDGGPVGSSIGGADGLAGGTDRWRRRWSGGTITVFF